MEKVFTQLPIFVFPRVLFLARKYLAFCCKTNFEGRATANTKRKILRANALGMTNYGERLEQSQLFPCP